MNREHYVRTLERGGFPRGQAEVQLTVFEDFMQNKVATREDMRRLELRMDRFEVRLEALESSYVSLNEKIDRLEKTLRQELEFHTRRLEHHITHVEHIISHLEHTITHRDYRLVLMLAGLMSALGIIFKYLLP